MHATQQRHATDELPAVTIAADPEAAQRAAEAHTAVILMACLLGLVGGTQLLVSFLDHLS